MYIDICSKQISTDVSQKVFYVYKWSYQPIIIQFEMMCFPDTKTYVGTSAIAHLIYPHYSPSLAHLKSLSKNSEYIQIFHHVLKT